jgi:hypothetical protein
MKAQSSSKLLLHIEKKAEAEINRKKLGKLIPGFICGIIYGLTIMANVLPLVNPLTQAIFSMTLGWLIIYGFFVRHRPRLFFLGLSPGLVIGIIIGLLIHYPSIDQLLTWILCMAIGGAVSIIYRMSESPDH